MKAFLKKHAVILIILAAFLLLAGIWLFIWHRIGSQVTKAAMQSAYDTLSFDGAYYAKCDLETVQAYLPETAGISRELCGEELGELSFPSENGTVTCPLYACKPLADAGKNNAIVLLEQADSISAYELSGFQYLDDQTSIWAVCASYGIGYAEDIEALEIKDQDGKLLETVTDRDRLSAFFEKFVKLGEDIGEIGVAHSYYEAYINEFGETDRIWFEDGTVKAENDEIYQQAMEFWTKDLRLVTIKLKNGYQLRDCIYAPVPGTFSVYGDYKITEPLF